MDTFLELIEAVQSDLTIGDESSFLPLTTVKLAINRAYINKISALFKWPQTEDAKLTSTESGADYYAYPSMWRPNSIWKLKVDGVDYGDPLAFKDYEYEVENDYPSGKTKLWANKALKYFIAPTPSTTGTNNIEVHGQMIPNKLVSDGDTTIFSYNMPECNEAIALEATAILKTKSEQKDVSQLISQEAKQIITTAWLKLSQELAKYERTQPAFIVGDMFGNNSVTKIGNF
jgi:hypothetical protein